jgi:hypothetical protein
MWWNIMHSCMKMESETCCPHSRNGGEGIKENDGGVNSTMIQCKHFGNCHNAPPAQQ